MEVLTQRPKWKREVNFEELLADDLVVLFQLYDREFFGGCVSAVFEEHNRFLDFCVVDSMPTQAGHFSRRGYHHSLTICWPIIKGAFADLKDDGSQTILVCGCPCTNRLQALMRVFEHELCHLLCFTNFFHVSDAHGDEFRAIAYAFFRHTRATHELPVLVSSQHPQQSPCWLPATVAAQAPPPPPPPPPPPAAWWHRQVEAQTVGVCSTQSFNAIRYCFDPSLCVMQCHRQQQLQQQQQQPPASHLLTASKLLAHSPHHLHQQHQPCCGCAPHFHTPPLDHPQHSHNHMLMAASAACAPSSSSSSSSFTASSTFDSAPSSSSSSAALGRCACRCQCAASDAAEAPLIVDHLFAEAMDCDRVQAAAAAAAASSSSSSSAVAATVGAAAAASHAIDHSSPQSSSVHGAAAAAYSWPYALSAEVLCRPYDFSDVPGDRDDDDDDILPRMMGGAGEPNCELSLGDVDMMVDSQSYVC